MALALVAVERYSLVSNYWVVLIELNLECHILRSILPSNNFSNREVAVSSPLFKVIGVHIYIVFTYCMCVYNRNEIFVHACY